jgi:hypothetical protein
MTRQRLYTRIFAVYCVLISFLFFSAAFSPKPLAFPKIATTSGSQDEAYLETMEKVEQVQKATVYAYGADLATTRFSDRRNTAVAMLYQ